MNVVNMMATTGSPYAASGMPQEYAGMGNLFAMQMGNALQNVQQTEALPMLPGDLSTADIEQLEGLLAMIQQLLAAGMLQQQELAPQVEQQLAELGQVVNQLPQVNAAAFVAQDRQNAIATFAQKGLSQEAAAKVVELMESLSKATETVKQPKWQEAGRQLQDLLAALGVQPTKEEKPAIARQNLFNVNVFATQAGEQNKDAKTTDVPMEIWKSTQPLRMNHALSSYQAEAGISSRFSTTAIESIKTIALQSDSAIVPETTAMPVQSPTVVMSPPAITGLAQLAQAGSGQMVQADQFAEQVTELFVKQMKIGSTNGVSEAKLILYPQSLGQVDVKITSQNGLITAQFAAETATGKELLDNQLPQLRAALTQLGLQVDRLEVTQQPAEQFGFQQQKEQSRQQRDGGRQQQKQQEERSEFSLDALVDRTEPIAAMWDRLKKAAGVEYSA